MTTPNSSSGLVLKNDASLDIFNEAFQSVIKFFVMDNWIYTIVLLACLIFALYISKKCEHAESVLDTSSIGPLEKVLQRITAEVGKSCSNTVWGLGLAVSIMLTPTLLRAANDDKTQAIVNVLGFIPGVLIGLIQLYSAYKIIVYVLGKLKPASPTSPTV